ncbi:hypothetical protein [Ideonella sp. B508-1]|uniref:hypothetical protein n=1 Tax=Ideonella sp. B508-1 TaxID=137716 RepID=UPI0009FBE732|nr:hypothetical protein [Ideonella sp. B508-1]
MTPARYLRVVSAIFAIRNKILNSIAKIICRRTITVDYRGLRIYFPREINIGNNFSAGRGLWLESVNGKGRIEIGNNVNFSDDVHIGSANFIAIGSGVLMGSGVLVSDHSHGAPNTAGGNGWELPPNQREIISKGKIEIKDNVWLGNGVCVLANVSIGEGAIVGANSVVLSDIPPRTIWAGIPAHQIWPKPIQ